jgi:hypothetical protein
MNMEEWTQIWRQKKGRKEGICPAPGGRGAAEEIERVGLSMVVAVEERGSVRQFSRYST